MFLSRPFKIKEYDKVIVGKRVVMGIRDDIKPIRGIDSKAQAKIVFSEGGRAEVVVQGETQDSTYLLEDCGEYWVLAQEIRREVLIK